MKLLITYDEQEYMVGGRYDNRDTETVIFNMEFRVS